MEAGAELDFARACGREISFHIFTSRWMDHKNYQTKFHTRVFT